MGLVSNTAPIPSRPRNPRRFHATSGTIGVMENSAGPKRRLLVCAGCGTTFEWKGRGRIQKYCNDACRDAAYAAERERARVIRQITCGHCTTVFDWDPKGGGAPPRYCHDDCQRLAQNERARQRKAATAASRWPVCRFCNTRFEWTQPGGRPAYCSDACEDAAAALKHACVCEGCQETYLPFSLDPSLCVLCNLAGDQVQVIAPQQLGRFGEINASLLDLQRHAEVKDRQFAQVAEARRRLEDLDEHSAAFSEASQLGDREREVRLGAMTQAAAGLLAALATIGEPA